MEATIKEEKMMFTVGEISEILGSVWEGDPDFRLTFLAGIEIDSRRIKKGYLFVAVRGEKLDGHDYVEQAFSNGAIAAVISKEQAAKRDWRGEKYIVTDDTIRALGKMAKSYRKSLDIKVIAVTGSNGKTTVKNLIYEILSTDGMALKSEKNYNNIFGLPLSIFKLTDRHKSAVFELGMSAPGEIRTLSDIASPDVAVITNVGPAHLQFFDNIGQIADAKLEIKEGIRPGGTLIINGDDDLLRSKIDNSQKTIRFGLGGGNDIHLENLEFDHNRLPSFTVNGIDFKSNLPGVHNVYNMLAAIAVAEVLGIDPGKYAEALSEYKSSDMRTQIVSKDGVTYIVDCYNANPVSMKYALDTLAGMKCVGRRIAVLGDMLELGEKSDEFHFDIGKYSREKGIDIVFCHGINSSEIARGYGDKAIYLESKTELADRLIRFIKPGDLILFKASRGIALEEIVEKILGDG